MAPINSGNMEQHSQRLVEPGIPVQVRLQLAMEVRDSLEMTHTPDYLNFLRCYFRAFSAILTTYTKPQATENAEHKLRNVVIEILNRLPHSEVLRPFVQDLLKLSLRVLTQDNKDNALLAIQIVFDLLRNFRPTVKAEVQPFLDFVVTIYHKFPTAVSCFFDNPNTSASMAASMPMQHLDPTADAPVTMQVPGGGQFNSSTRSFKIVTESPLVVMFLFQLYSKLVQTNIPHLLPLMVAAISIKGPDKVPPHLTTPFNDLKGAQVKTLSSLTYLLKSNADYIKSSEESICKSIVTCPPDSVSIRKAGFDLQSGEDDRLSMLTDDLLVSILLRVDITTTARTSALSTRWRNLPWLLPELNIDVTDFLPIPSPNPIEVGQIDHAMTSLTKAIRSLLSKPRNEFTITSLHLNIYLVNSFSCEIGSLLSNAIDNGILKGLDLVILDEKEPSDCFDEEMLQKAQDVNGFFVAYPSVLVCLTKLSLYNVCFAKWDIHHVLFDCCKQLKHIALFHCDAGHRSLWRIDAPNSNVSVLEFYSCCFEKLEVVCLPKLEMLHWDTWTSHHSPLSFGFVPNLKELHLLCGATHHHKGFNLSELLSGTSGIHTLTLDFQGEKLWMHPEIKQLCTAFKMLRKLSIHGIFVQYDLAWTMSFLEAAPSIELLHIQVWEHACEVDDEARRITFPERSNPSWALDLDSSAKNLLLKELQVVGFRPLEQQIVFIRAVLGRAPNLERVVLREDLEPCEDCDAMDRPLCSSTGHVFPKNKGEQSVIVTQVTDGIISSAQMIFGS